MATMYGYVNGVCEVAGADAQVITDWAVRRNAAAGLAISAAGGAMGTAAGITVMGTAAGVPVSGGGTSS